MKPENESAQRHATRVVSAKLLWLRVSTAQPEDRWPLLEASYGDHLIAPGVYVTDTARFVVSTEMFRDDIGPALIRVPWSVEVIVSDGAEEDSDLLTGISHFYPAPVIGTINPGPKTMFCLNFSQVYWGKDRKTVNDPPRAPILEPILATRSRQW